MSYFLVLFTSALAQESEQKEYDDIQRTGDIFVVGLPALTVGASLAMGDSKGSMMWFKSLGVNAAVTFGLKKAVGRERPDKSDTQSFPSAHSSMTFHSAAYIHFRYGLLQAAIPYLAASFTAYSRVHSKKHYTSDVIAGALIGIASAAVFTKKNPDYITTDQKTDDAQTENLTGHTMQSTLIGSTALLLLPNNSPSYTITPYLASKEVALHLQGSF